MYGEPLFRNREHAGQALAERLQSIVSDSGVLVLGLPRGGVVVAYEISTLLQADLDVFLVRKLGMPGDEEFAIGAIASGGTPILNEETVSRYRVPPEAIAEVVAKEQKELARREQLYRETRPAFPIAGRTVVLVDDGLATGSTMLAACRALQTKGPRRVIAAVPVGSRQACEQVRMLVDEMVCLATPEPFTAIGIWYDDFAQTTDGQVRELLERASRDVRS